MKKLEYQYRAGWEFGIPDNPPSDPFPEDAGVNWSNLVNHVQRSSCQSIFPHAPPIIYPDHPHDELPFIDGHASFETDYLGRYFPGGDKNTGCTLSTRSGRRIEIYKPRIDRCAHDIGVSKRDLEVVVVVHELLHAVLHLGCAPASEIQKPSLDIGQMQRFISRRLDFWKRLWRSISPSRVLELHAQLGTFHVIESTIGPKHAFFELMKHQPNEYRVSHSLLATAPYMLWGWSCYARSNPPVGNGSIITAKGMEGYLLDGVESSDADLYEQSIDIASRVF